MKTKWILEPVAYKNNITGKILFDHVVVKENSKHEYPIALLHIDTFYDNGRTDIHEAIEEGKAVKVEVTFLLVEDD